MLSSFNEEYHTFYIGVFFLLISSAGLLLKKKIYKGIDIFLLLIILCFSLGTLIFLIYLFTNKVIYFPAYTFGKDMLGSTIRAKFALAVALINAYAICSRLPAERIQYYFYKFFIYTVIILLIALYINKDLLVEIFLTTKRFHGFSFRPTQLAGVLSILFFMGFHPYIKRRLNKWFFVLCILSIFAVSILTESEGLWVAIVVTLLINQIVKFKNALMKINKKKTTLLIVNFLIVALIASPFIFYFSFHLFEGSRGQASGRLMIWISNLRAVSYSPLFGFGPGSYSGVGNEPFAGKEAHNTILDFLGYGGLFFILLITYIYYKIFSKIRIDNYYVLSFICLTIYGMFHNMGRAPYFWIMLFFLYQLRNDINDYSVNIRGEE